MDFSKNEPFYSYRAYLQNRFGGKTYKVVVSSGLTCPTRDGTLAKKGCAFCDVRGSSSFHGKQGRGKEIKEQLAQRIPPIRARFKAEHLLAYFQSYTNTYSDAEYLREIYESALSFPEIEGLCIGTRPDCLPDSVILLLEELAKTHYVSLELGVQSLHNPTLEWLDRGHDRACSLLALEKVARMAPHVHTCVHLMFGSPTEPNDIGKTTAQALAQTGIQGVKLHQLMVLENTVLADRYREAPFKLISIEEYARVTSEFLEHLPKNIYVERLYANATHPDECLGPDWSKERWSTHNTLRRHYFESNVWQGKALDTSASV